MTQQNSRLMIVLFTIILNIGAVIYFANVPWSDWRTGALLNLIDNFILIVYSIYRRDVLMAHLLLFGLGVGFVELPADAWLVDFTKTLDYSIGGGPMIWRSPLWMPFAWEVVAVQFAVLGLWFIKRWKRTGLIMVGLLGAVNIPFYEEMALRTKWWAYHSCKMFLHTPYYIILGEFLIVLCIVALARRINTERLLQNILLGIGGGLSIFVGYALAYGIIEWFL